MRDQIQLLMVHYFGKIRDGSVKIESNVTNDIKPNLDQVSTAVGCCIFMKHFSGLIFIAHELLD